MIQGLDYQQLPLLKEIIDSVHQIVTDRLTISHMAEKVGISHEQVENILNKELGMFKVSAR